MTDALKLPKKQRSFCYLAGLYETDSETVLKACLENDRPNEASDIVSSGALTPGGLASVIPIDTDDGELWLEVIERNPEREPGVYTCYCVSEGFVEVTEDQERQYKYDRDWLIKVLKNHLKLSGEQVTVIPELLEWLGNIQVDGQPYQVLLARHLTSMSGFKSIYQNLESWQGKAPGVVLTVSERFDHLLPLPGPYPIVSIMSLLSSEGPCEIDTRKLKDVLRATFQPDLGSLEVEWEYYGSQGRFEASGCEPWDIRGGQRCKVANMIYDAWLAGNRGVTTEQIKEEGISYTHPRNCFNDSDQWEDYIQYENRLWSLKAEPRSRRAGVS
ncbi:hypothetical protein [Endozoicomonas sp. ONNA1]|uniref:hypothetical protein n=2 Tax=unclassified Endozoicomonas TaxID=2644528 RepID=UPI0021484BCA|nr:hypothetical protein [Endozoicomonas sp. ONNA1]